MTLIAIYAGMHRDTTVSYITGTRAGELGLEYWRQLVTFGIGLLLALLTAVSFDYGFYYVLVAAEQSGYEVTRQKEPLAGSSIGE